MAWHCFLPLDSMTVHYLCRYSQKYAVLGTDMFLMNWRSTAKIETFSVEWNVRKGSGHLGGVGQWIHAAIRTRKHLEKEPLENPAEKWATETAHQGHLGFKGNVIMTQRDWRTGDFWGQIFDLHRKLLCNSFNMQECGMGSLGLGLCP